MSKCNKAKNPCKICLGPVTQKNGLQCQGACESWVHYACLNYTPGRIKDIKAGIIKVTCPCPDCKTIYPKEFRTDEPYSCTNMQCPANKPPQCGNMKCPRNAGMDTMPQGYGIPCPLGTCGKGGGGCKQNSHPMLTKLSELSSPCNPQQQGPQMPMISSSDACIDFSKCPSGCGPINVAGDMRRMPTPNMPMQNMPMQNMPMQNMPMQMPMQNMGVGGPMVAMPSLTAMQQMCNTIGLLSNQMQDVMTRMRAMGGGQDDDKDSPTAKRKKNCPKPCYCPDNPKK